MAKRRAARHFNDLVVDAGGGQLDGRTAKRRARLLGELHDGCARSTKRPLKAIDILLRVQELLELGEPLASIKKAAKPQRPLPPTDELIDGVRSIHGAYAFRKEVYAFVGIDDATLRKAGVDPRGKGGAQRGGASHKPGVAKTQDRARSSRRAARRAA
ncbi:MAG: hypothetical protein U0271_27380 [Polyangiaceae bacterium]